ncbi:MAG TPA: aldehyde dehydrogenase [Bacteroidetes bacterium]|nr:aldehyde dehydrogenase [Bacteroidota bacterium]HCN38664.1 aldehyde dehydrogenase [Bacteroidota bacterium]
MITMKQKFILDINPANGELIEKIKCSSYGEIASAIKLARKAWRLWINVPLKNRIAMMKKVAKDFLKEKEILGEIITMEMGKPLKSAIGEAEAVAYGIEEAIEMAEEAFATQVLNYKDTVTEIHRSSIGVVAVITPWNFPAAMAESLISPAILGGNTVVFKPSEYTPLTGKYMYEVFNRHLPKGAVNLLQGAEEVGEVLITSDVDMIAFVGSQEVGKRIMEASAKRLNRLVLELGGKDPMIILKDADIEKAAKYAVNGSLRNAGQVCVAVERIYVEDKIADKFEKQVLENVKKWKVGPGTDESSDMGPIVSENQRLNILSQIEDAERKGAKILWGGKKVEGKGFFMEPTVITNLADKHLIMQKETFGPVVCIQKVSSAEEAIEKANNTTFGLGATVWSKNDAKAKEVARKIESGMIGINQGIGGVPRTPWVGAKQSGFGFIGSIEGMRQFTIPKKISYKKK